MFFLGASSATSEVPPSPIIFTRTQTQTGCIKSATGHMKSSFTARVRPVKRFIYLNSHEGHVS